MLSASLTTDRALTGPDRRSVMGSAFAASMLLGGVVHAGLTAPGTGETWLKLVADLSGKTVVTVLRGDVWGFLPQADDLTVGAFARRLYGYWGLSARKVERRPSHALAMKTKGWSFYLDAQTGAVIERMRNPYTGANVETKPLSGAVSNTVYASAEAALGDAEVTVRRLGEHAFVDVARISRFTSPDIAWFKLEADFNTHVCRAADLDDPGLTHAPSTFSHNLVAEWQTWMKMHGTPGHILFRGNGASVNALMAAPRPLLDAVERYFPGSLRETIGWTEER